MVLSAGCWAENARHSFNSEGRYFDSETGIVHEDWTDIYRSATALFAMTSIAAETLARRVRRRREIG